MVCHQVDLCRSQLGGCRPVLSLQTSSSSPVREENGNLGCSKSHMMWHVKKVLGGWGGADQFCLQVCDPLRKNGGRGKWRSQISSPHAPQRAVLRTAALVPPSSLLEIESLAPPQFCGS